MQLWTNMPNFPLGLLTAGSQLLWKEWVLSHDRSNTNASSLDPNIKVELCISNILIQYKAAISMLFIFL